MDQKIWDEPPPNAAVLATSAIEVDIPCFHCGYNLRSRSLEDLCPECGRLVKETFRGAWLSFADKAWLARLRAGTAWIFLLILALLILFVGIAFVDVASSIAPSQWLPIPLAVIASVFFLGLSRMGWLLSPAEPIDGHEANLPSLTAWLRGLSVLAAAVGIAVGWIIATDVDSVILHRRYHLFLRFGLTALCLIAYSTGAALLSIHLRSIIRRSIYKTRLAHVFTVLAGGYLLLSFLLATIVLLAIVMSITYSGPTPLPTSSPSTQFTATGSTGFLPSTQSTTAPTITAPVVRPRIGDRLVFMLMSRGACILPIMGLALVVASLVALLMFRRCLGQAMNDPLRSQFITPIDSADSGF